ncbi:MAG: hypothetical protein WAM11_14250, partial [Cyanobium sp.]
ATVKGCERDLQIHYPYRFSPLPEGSEQLQQSRRAFQLRRASAQVQIDTPQPQCAASEGLDAAQINFSRTCQSQCGFRGTQSQGERLGTGTL